jgi:D-alanyl-D-alanine carboxypeptidase
MNGKAKSLAMLRTRFANPHGLDHVNNYSCCEDVYAMCTEAMRNEVFRKITRTVTHKGFFKFFKEGKVVSKAIFWTNTNKLLEKREVIGIKTGITGRAGGCLATAFTIDEKGEGFIVVLGSNSTEGRFRDTLKIMSWIQESLTEPRD